MINKGFSEALNRLDKLSDEQIALIDKYENEEFVFKHYSKNKFCYATTDDKVLLFVTPYDSYRAYLTDTVYLSDVVESYVVFLQEVEDKPMEAKEIDVPFVKLVNQNWKDYKQDSNSNKETA